MKIKKYVFRDHYKVSMDRFRDILGLYFDFKDNVLTEESNPRKGIMIHSVFEIAAPVVVNEEQGVYNQNIIFKPANIPENELYLNATFRERFLEDIGGGALVPRRMNLDSPTAGFDPVVPDEEEESTDAGANAGAEAPPDYTIPLDPVKPPPVVTNRDMIYETIRGLKRYEDINTTADEVTELKSSTTDAYISADSRYNFYVPGYESQIQQPVVPEEILPNFYVVSLALNRDILDSISQEDFNSQLAVGSSSPYENLYQKFDRFITLDGNLSLERNANVGFFFALALVAYIQQYADVYDSVSVDYIETVKKRFGHIYTNLTNKEILDKLNEFKHSYPMFINIEWTTSTLSPLLLFLQNAGISLQALQTFLGDKLVIRIQSTTLSATERFSILAQPVEGGPLFEYSKDLYTYDAGQWIADFLSEIFSGTNDEIVHPNELFVIDQNEQQIPIGDQLNPLNHVDNLFEVLTAIAAIPGYQNLLNTSMRTYSQILDGALATSEVLLYKIEKRDSQHRLLQTFYVPNVSGINVQNYVDTQVKFNKEYKYKIFAYTVIYGTEYYYDRYLDQQDDNYFYKTAAGHLSTFTKVHLGLDSDPTKDEIIGKVEGNRKRKYKEIKTDITFSCFFRVHSADEGHPLIDVFASTSAGAEYVLGFFGDSGGLQVNDLELGRWYNLTIVCRTPKAKSLDILGTRELYIDAKYVGFVVGDPITNWNDRTFISGYGPGNIPDWDFFGGIYYTVERDISNIAIFSRAFSPEEVKALVNVGRCGDIRNFKKGKPPLDIPDWPGEVPAIYWRKKDENKEVTNDGYAGLANLILHGDAESLKCDVKKRDDNAEVDPSADTEEVDPGGLQPRPFQDEVPERFDIPQFSEEPPEIFRLPPTEPGDPFKKSAYYEETNAYAEGVEGYGEISIPLTAYGDKAATCECPPADQGKKVWTPPTPIPVPEIPPPRDYPGKYEQPPINVVSEPPPNAYAYPQAEVQPKAFPTKGGKRKVYPSKTPTAEVITTTTPPSTSIPKPIATKEQVAGTGSTTSPVPISVGGGTQPPLPRPKKTVFKRTVKPDATLPENRVSELPPPTTETNGPITPIEKPIIIPKTKRKPLTKGEKR